MRVIESFEFRYDSGNLKDVSSLVEYVLGDYDDDGGYEKNDDYSASERRKIEKIIKDNIEIKDYGFSYVLKSPPFSNFGWCADANFKVMDKECPYVFEYNPSNGMFGGYTSIVEENLDVDSVKKIGEWAKYLNEGNSSLDDSYVYAKEEEAQDKAMEEFESHMEKKYSKGGKHPDIKYPTEFLDDLDNIVESDWDERYYFFDEGEAEKLLLKYNPQLK